MTKRAKPPPPPPPPLPFLIPPSVAVLPVRMPHVAATSWKLPTAGGSSDNGGKKAEILVSMSVFLTSCQPGQRLPRSSRVTRWTNRRQHGQGWGSLAAGRQLAGSVGDKEGNWKKSRPGRRATVGQADSGPGGGGGAQEPGVKTARGKSGWSDGRPTVPFTHVVVIPENALR